jgi:DNA-binding transcriptional regulator LsrR (DeoR family)
MRSQRDRAVVNNPAESIRNRRERLKPSTEEMVKAARWFYQDEKTKQDIATLLKTDRRNVTRILEEAKASGLVHIDIFEPSGADTQRLEDGLMRKFPHLLSIKIVPNPMTGSKIDYSALLRRWAVEAARFFEVLADKSELLQVGISGGESYLRFANAVSERPRKQVYVFATTLIGRGHLTFSASHIDSLVNASVLWSKCGCEPGHNFYATVPPYGDVRRPHGVADELRELSRRQSIKLVIKRMDEINLAFAGIGMVVPPEGKSRDKSRFTMLSLLESQGLVTKDCTAQGAIGEMGGCLFDADGNVDDRWRFYLSAGHYHRKGGGIEFYKRMVQDGKRVVVIGGYQKELALHAALKAKAFNCWFTNEIAARMILEMK